MDSARLRSTAIPADLIAAMLGSGALAVGVFAILQNGAWARPVAALLIGGALIYLALRYPQAAILATFAFLPLLGLIRRLLIPVAGWTSTDPLLLVAPLVGVVLLQRAIVRKERVASPDLLAKLVLALLLITLLEAANPVAGSVGAGLTGLLFLAAPMLWFFVGREVAQNATILKLEWGVIVIAVAAALYGLTQILVGLPPWDGAWLRQAGYSGLVVFTDAGPATAVRPFATFTGSAEYATFLSMALALCVALALQRRLLALAAVPVLAPALFLTSQRGAVAILGLTIVVLVAVWMRHPLAGVATIGAVMVSLLLAMQLVQPLADAASSSSNPLVAHQLGGLLQPLDAQHSSLPQHVERIVDGLKWSVQNPLGAGTAATNLAGAKLSGLNFTTEIDLSDVFISLGLLGGVLFLAVVVGVLVRAVTTFRLARETVVFGLTAVLIVTLGQWLNGGQYAVAPLVWLLAGWVTAQVRVDHERQPAGLGWYGSTE
jgi:hypothetical protein